MTTLDELSAKLDQLAEAIGRLERQAPAEQPELLTVAGAAKALSVSLKTVYRRVKCGDLRAVKVGADLRIPLSEVRRVSTPKAAAARPSRRKASSGSYDARAEAEAIRRANGARR